MASAVITVAAGGEAGALFRRLAQVIAMAAANVPDKNATGASVTMTINDTPSSGIASILIAGGGLPTQTTYLV